MRNLTCSYCTTTQRLPTPTLTLSANGLCEMSGRLRWRSGLYHLCRRGAEINVILTLSTSPTKCPQQPNELWWYPDHLSSASLSLCKRVQFSPRMVTECFWIGRNGENKRYALVWHCLAISMATFHRFNFYGGAKIAHVALTKRPIVTW